MLLWKGIKAIPRIASDCHECFGLFFVLTFLTKDENGEEVVWHPLLFLPALISGLAWLALPWFLILASGLSIPNGSPVGFTITTFILGAFLAAGEVYSFKYRWDDHV